MAVAFSTPPIESCVGVSSRQPRKSQACVGEVAKKQKEDPTTPWYWPDGQVSHDVEADIELNLPIGQSMHVAWSVTFWNLNENKLQ
jgi:hypothetical protein